MLTTRLYNDQRELGRARTSWKRRYSRAELYDQPVCHQHWCLGVISAHVGSFRPGYINALTHHHHWSLHGGGWVGFFGMEKNTGSKGLQTRESTDTLEKHRSPCRRSSEDLELCWSCPHSAVKFPALSKWAASPPSVLIAPDCGKQVKHAP